MLLRPTPPQRRKRRRAGATHATHAAHATSGVTLSPAYQTWVAENLLRDVPARTLSTVLASVGLDPRLSAREIAVIERSPILQAARASARQSKQLARVRRLQ